MSDNLQVTIASRREGDSEWYEGTVSISGLKPTKLARKSDGSTRFTSRSAVTGAARNLAKSLGYLGVDIHKESDPKKVAKTPKSSMTTLDNRWQ